MKPNQPKKQIEEEKRKTGLIVGHGRWAKDLCEGDTVEIIKGSLKGERFTIVYQKEWAAFIAEQGEGGMIFWLAKDNTWTDDDRPNRLTMDEIKIL